MSTINSFNGEPITINRYFGSQDPTDSTRFKNVGDEFYNTNSQVWFKAIGRTGSTYSWQAITTSPTNPPASSPVTIVGYDEFKINGQCFPSIGSAPLSAFADIQSGLLNYSAAAYTGLQLTYQPQDLVNGVVHLDVSIPVYAEGVLTQELSQVMLAFYDQQSGFIPAATLITGTTGVASYSSVVNFQMILNSANYPSGINLYLCAFFDQNVATSNMDLVVNGFKAGNITETYTYQSIVGKFVETSPSNP